MALRQTNRFERDKLTLDKRRKPASNRLFHYYARYLSHASGVTDAVDHWLDASKRIDPHAQIFSAGVLGIDADADRVKTISHLGRDRRSWLPIGLIGRLRRGDILVIHEGWVLSNLAAALITRMSGAHYVVMPHGVYEQGIVSNQRDRFGLRHQAERLVIRHAAAVHVFYPGEQAVVRRMEPKVRHFITLPNGAPDSSPSWRGSGDFFLYLGRFDPFHKGLDNLLQFWSRLPTPRPHLKLVGPDFQDGKRVVGALIRELGLTESVRIERHASGQRKAQLMAQARAYIHPSRWESCSITLLEMLSAGVPALVSSTIHASVELEQADVFRIVDFENPDVNAESIIACVDTNADLGRRAARWVAKEGNWASIETRFVVEYSQLSETLRGVGK